MFEITVSEIEGAVTIELIGRFVDREDAETFLEAVTDKLDAGRRKFLVHCGQLRFSNTNGLGALVKAHLAITQASAHVAYCGNPKLFLALKPLQLTHTVNCEEALKTLLAMD